ncbi:MULTISPECIES: hypothetical protein [unclassified Streptomyces]|uniref:hypothetical protein n=1 Tax=unclassified Streptomyces TaxID=2593676 RepID=UPI0008862893|nr:MULTISPECIES: hypothetical protein [unclassified Streptomyces]PBC72252.1 hypothetical protein BX261_7336 [Streptomyces sp. 2321.6]SDR61961.1 hypothetical protein SAMN05216511_7233 [Streptomyces sp. KS_16]SEE49182.1 hypothetical protein SAMN05428940_7282 [Streptomyces sp. 2133.1]SNC77757.1 hypothetical protein SAMN06272741_7173 [Streptomyces sp. 2114.4]
MAKLAKTVFVTDPERAGVSVRLDAGQEVPEHLESAVTNPDAWEDGKLPAAAAKAAAEEQRKPEPSPDDDGDDKPAAKKTAANRPARGRKSAADEGEGS